MSNDPRPLPDILTGPPAQADYDAVHGTVMATDRGRAFLAEYAKRNRHADTQVLVDAIARIEAAIRGDRPLQVPAAASRGLMEIAAELERIEAVIADEAPPSNSSAAVERIQDIAYVLHERPVEATLCDALDAAVCELVDAGARSAGAADRVRNAKEMLDALGRRVAQMIAACDADSPTANSAAVESMQASAGGEVDAATLLRGPALEVAGEQLENLAQAVAGLAASLPALADEAEPPLEPQNGIVAVSEQAGAAAGRASSDVIPNKYLRDEPSNDAIPDDGRSSDEARSNKPSNGDLLPDVDLDMPMPIARAEEQPLLSAADDPADDASAANTIRNTESTPSRPSTYLSEDSENLFEPPALPVRPLNPTVATAQPEAESPSASPQASGPSAPPEVPSPQADDPLAALRALSAEELIALFS